MTDNCPVATPESMGSNCTLSESVWPGVRITGKLLGTSVKLAPEAVAPVMTTGADPTEVRLTFWEARVFSATVPKSTLAEPALRVGKNAARERLKLLEIVPALAVRLADSAVKTGETDAVNWTLVAFAGTSAEDDTDTAALSLDKMTLKPFDGAGVLIVAVQVSASAPTTTALLQLRSLNVGKS